MNLKYISLAVVLLAGLALASCHTSRTIQKTSVPAGDVTADLCRRVEVPEFMKALEDSSVVLIDVRTAGEHAEGCITGTQFNFDVLEEDFAVRAKEQLQEGCTVAIYCRSGNRSQKAAQILVKEGFHVIELASGWKGWCAAQECKKK